jgi:signal transduction histidine kinase
MRREVPAESHKRLERVVASGVRMQRMIEQLLDVTRARLAGGVPVERGEPRDLVPLVGKIVDEVRASCPPPGRSIGLRAVGTCRLRIDPERVSQMVATLVGNAVMHGDPHAPVQVEVTEEVDAVRLTVVNGGTIPPATMSALFDPFRRANLREAGSDGLGLGLFIAQCIVRSHGGALTVESGDGTTRFEAVFPAQEP